MNPQPFPKLDRIGREYHISAIAGWCASHSKYQFGSWMWYNLRNEYKAIAALILFLCGR